MFLKPEEEVVGFYKMLRITNDGIVVILKSGSDKKLEICFPSQLVRPEILQKKFDSIKIGQKIGILRVPYSKPPIRIRKIRHGKNKRATIYVGVKLYARLEKYQEPGESIDTGIEKLLGIAENRETLVVVMNQGEISCNKMKHLRQSNRVYCRRLEVIVSKEYCAIKCIVARQLKELSKKNKPSKTKAAPSLESFLQTPKNEQLRYPPKTKKDPAGSCWIFSGFLRVLDCCSKTVGDPSLK